MSETSDQRALLSDTFDKLFRDMMDHESPHAEDPPPEAGGLSASLWQRVEVSDVTSILVAQSAGGFGGGWEDVFALLYQAGFHAVPLPIAETALARRLLARAEISAPPGAIALSCAGVAQVACDTNRAWRLTGHATDVPWGDAASHIAVACESDGVARLALVRAVDTRVMERRSTIAGEPVADLAFEGAEAVGVGFLHEDPYALCALTRAILMAGALDALLHYSVQHVNERRQFGKPIAKFQAIQHSLALLANESAAVNCAALAACRAADRGDAAFEIGAAKLRANRAVGTATSIAHQVHGAIGFTREYKLHRATQRLWSWRSEYGNDRYWASYLGERVCRWGAQNFWPRLTGLSDGT